MKQQANLNATVGIFFDSFAKIALSIAVLTSIIKLTPTLVHQQIIPGVCISLFVLNFAYYWQAKYMTKSSGKIVTALPSGLQASCVFVWLFAIMLPIVSKTHNPLLAYKVALFANLLNAIFFTLSGIILIKLKKFIPPVALFSGLAGTAFTWLAVNNLPTLAEHPLSGLLPMLVILALTLSKIKIKLPLILVGVVLGTVLALITKEFSLDFTQFNHTIGINLPTFILLDISPEVIHTSLNYLPLILAFALIDSISAIQILEESRLSGDNFNPTQSICISGIISGASSFIGNPFAMALFFGHYSWKQTGATQNYSLYNGVIYALLGITGFATLLIAFIPNWVTLPILIMIGITSTAISFNALKSDEYIILIIGIIPILTELIYNKLELFALENNITNFTQQSNIGGLFLLAKGSILFSLLLTSLFYYIMQHKWLAAAFGCSLLSLFCSIGFIHYETPGWHFFTPINYVYLIGIGLCLITAWSKKHHAVKI